MAALQSSFTSLNLDTSFFLGQRVAPSLHLPPVKLTEQPSSIVAKLKRWERKECKPNSLPVLHKMHVKLGDTVKVISGKDKGKVGEIEAPIHSSNVMLYSKEKDVVSRVGHKTLDDGKRVRYLIKTGEIIDGAENWKRVAKEKEKATELATAS
ncbi:60S ribosomal protein L24, variant 2 [Salvia divinorum]|uniref:60S ribosomal protein L24, variant 2 n=1 Tax=Salvia divinorum TaxID=28513 RepID=A0ABD1IED2_SALDI